MKKILIIGKSSYVGMSLEKWLGYDFDRYSTDSISVRNDRWKEMDFSVYDVVIHVAGIAHIKETKENAEIYYKVNRDLAYEVAQKAKVEGVEQFIFFSSMSVYGIESGVIDKNSSVQPKSNYGKSKLQAEELLLSIEESFFRVAILRPPMIYGKGCKGNYTKLGKFALIAPIFPDIENKRSMIFIYNLCEFVRLLIDNFDSGVYFPQNRDYVKTSNMVELIAETHGKKIWKIKFLNPIVYYLRRRIGTVNKVFGDLVYDKEISIYKEDYYVVDYTKSIKVTEQK
ncbi:NAD-dependent epimerase/dehydratase family protein [Lysinibacillus sp. SGAir0095]|uniref:NAD-dependent epimerase/dehydratase family protein n=1 Tax=Lysinibacillus sp. SGAir0095 TaxID=2070463 RepID=UPI0010CCDE86|nr:NAD-dependent epimerase/dehydratase family protein [Lysinibacillus sp. SGAir0095]QCR31885.1 NAD-dependent epimerase [Lysinibacillus sp. SGAir0095]